jgi:hypothetical protein
MQLIIIAANSQNYYHFGYDACGNRNLREYNVIPGSPQRPNNQNNNDSASNITTNINAAINKIENLDSTSAKDNKNFKHESFLGERKITICPNPTTGELRIDISNLNPNNKGTIIVNDNLGKIIKEIKQISSSNFIDISNVARGSYILKIVLDGKSKEWIIVKQ